MKTMISKNLIYALAIGMMAMLVPISLQIKWYKIKWWKSLLVTVVLTVVGTAGTYLMYFIENLQFAGTSFYGAVFLVPAAFLWFQKVIRIPYGVLMGLCAPAECIMLAIMKFKCNLDGCCAGRELFINSEGKAVVFPSQMVELVVALLLFAVLMVIAYKKENASKLYPLYLVSYGTIRFVLNFFRDTSVGSLLLPFGNIWSLVAIALGIMWLHRIREKTDAIEET